jgi:hypothetical protein
MHHPMRVITRTDDIATKIRVEAFEMLKQKSDSATKNITILSKRDFINVNQVQPLKRQDMTYDHISNAQGRLKTIAIGSSPKILSEF